jgi:hypothetical protein
MRSGGRRRRRFRRSADTRAGRTKSPAASHELRVRPRGMHEIVDVIPKWLDHTTPRNTVTSSPARLYRRIRSRLVRELNITARGAPRAGPRGNNGNGQPPRGCWSGSMALRQSAADAGSCG